MKVNRALYNPRPIDQAEVLEEPEDSQLQNSQTSQDQVGMEIDDTNRQIKQRVSSFRMFLKRRLDIIEVAQIWKNPSIPFMLTTGVFNIFVLLVGGILSFSNLPPSVQLFYDPTLETWTQQGKIDKTVAVFIIPIFLSVVTLIQYRLISQIFKNDKRLAVTIAWLMTYVNILLLIAISQIYRLN